MKLNNSLMVTLPDFTKHFNYMEFWENRRQFVRDMHPSKVYYWDKELEDAYFSVANWIDRGDDVMEDEKARGIGALELLLGRKIDDGEIGLSEGHVDLSSPIIRVLAGTDLILPEYEKGLCDRVELSYHKIEVYGNSNKPARIRIGTGGEEKLLCTGEFVYVTALNGRFIEFLPTHLENNANILDLVSKEGKFASTLYCRRLSDGNTVWHEEVISFALAYDGYMFIDNKNGIKVFSPQMDGKRWQLRCGGAEPFYIKCRNGEAIVLYRRGTLASTMDTECAERIIKADICQDCTIKYLKL